MKYTITFAPEAQEGLAKLKRSEPASYKKAVKLLNVLTILILVQAIRSH